MRLNRIRTDHESDEYVRKMESEKQPEIRGWIKSGAFALTESLIEDEEKFEDISWLTKLSL